jgi:Na+-transporting methylmalonyl-CoA/oxaloacetate decarboxylase gamma subunit
VVIAVVFIFYLLAAMNLRKAFNALAEKSGEHMFETAGLLLFLGAILTIILVGFVLIFLAWVFATIAFFSIKVPSQPYSYTPPQVVAPTMQATCFCPNCGAPQDPNATFCSHCGKQLPPP